MAGTIAALFVARWLAIHASRWSWREIGAEERESILWMLPRGLITVVLALEVTAARGAELSFLPGLAFAVILATNLMVVLGSWRAKAPQTEARADSGEAEPAPVAEMDIVPVPGGVVVSRRRHRWALDAGLLVLLGISGLVLWYGTRGAGGHPGWGAAMDSPTPSPLTLRDFGGPQPQPGSSTPAATG